jgi:hypothetical protein
LVGCGRVGQEGESEQPGSATTSTFTTGANGRVTRILAPVLAGVSCMPTLVAGCKALTINYATTTTWTGTGGDPATWGDSAGRVSSISAVLDGPSLWSWLGTSTT